MGFEVDSASMLSGSLTVGLVIDLAIDLAIDLTIGLATDPTAWRERWRDRSRSIRQEGTSRKPPALRPGNSRSVLASQRHR